jgi:hypothetical protein
VLEFYRRQPRRRDQLRRDGAGQPLQLGPCLHAPDPARLSPLDADPLDPGQPLLPLDAGDPRLGCRNNVELIPTPTYASYLNRIESHFGAIGEFVVKNADYLDWDSFALAMGKHISYRNAPDRRRERLERAEKRLRLAA